MKNTKIKLISYIVTLTMFVSLLIAPQNSINVKAATIRYPNGEDYSEPGEGYIYVEANGSFAEDAIVDILEKVNAIRREACEKKVPYPSLNTTPTGKYLSMDDYKPVKWSESLQWKSQIRAVESSVSFSHDRPSGKNGPTMPGADVSSFYETISSGSRSVVGAINQWYSEMNTYISKEGQFLNNTGHYSALIDPRVEYIGISVFNSTGAGEYSSSIYGHSTNTSEKDIRITGDVTHLVEVATSNVKSIVFRENNKNITSVNLTKGDIYSLNLCAYLSGYRKIFSGATYESSNPTVASVSGDGKITSKAVGTTIITAKISENVKAELEITVRAITSVDDPKDITVESGESPEDSLPTKVTANWSDGTTSQEDITWGIISDDYKKREGGSFEIEGTIDNYEEKIVQKVIVNPATVTSFVIPEGIVTESGTAPTLPVKTEVSWSNGDVSEEPIIWDKPILAEYSARLGGTFDIGGKVEGDSFTTKYEVVPAYITDLDYTSDINTKESVEPQLPELVNVTWSNGDSSEETVIWEEIDEEKYQSPESVFDVTGVISGYSGVNKDVVITVTVLPKELTKITIKEDTVTGTEFYDNYDWSKVDGTVIASFDNNTTSELSMQELVNDCDNESLIKNQTVNVSYTYRDVTKSTEVELILYLPEKLKITKPEKITYIEGQDFDETGLKVITVYDDGSEVEPLGEDGNPAYILSGYDNKEIGIQTIEVEQSGKKGSFEIEVIPKKVVEINVSGLDYQKIRKDINLTDGTMTLIYNDGDKKEESLSVLKLNNLVEIMGYDKDTLGEQEISVRYFDNYTNAEEPAVVETSVNVEVKDRITEEVEILSLPKKTAYIEGQKLDVAGATVEISYDNDENEVVVLSENTDDKLKITGYDENYIGTQTINVEKEGKSDTFTVTVREKQIESVAFTGPSKTVYLEGQDFDLSGVSAVIKYDNDTSDNASVAFDSDGSTLAATALLYNKDDSISNKNLKAGSYTFNIVYKSYISDDYSIEVKAPVKDMPSEITKEDMVRFESFNEASSNEDIMEALEGATIEVPCAGGTNVETVITKEMIGEPETLDSKDSISDEEKKIVEDAEKNSKVVKKVAIQVSKNEEDEPVYTYVYLAVDKKPEPTPTPTPTVSPTPIDDKTNVTPTPEPTPMEEPVISQDPSDDDEYIEPGKVVTVGSARYKVLDEESVEYAGVANKKIKSVVVPASVDIMGDSYQVTAIGANAFKGCNKLKSVKIGANVATIGDSAFYKCTSLTSVTIPKKVKKIGKKAFYGCKKLKTITIKTTKLKKSTIGSKAFKGIYKKAKFKCPKSKLKNYKKWLKKAGAPKKAKYKK